MRKTGLGIFLLVLALGGCGSLAEKETFPEEERKIVQLGTGDRILRRDSSRKPGGYIGKRPQSGRTIWFHGICGN